MQVHLMVLAPEAAALNQAGELGSPDHPLLLPPAIQLHQLAEKVLPLEAEGLQPAVGTAVGDAPDVAQAEHRSAALAGYRGLHPLRADYAGVFGLVGTQLGYRTLH
jgi:hypothetical protein